MKDINVLLFDVDGTLLDTGEFILQATEHALKHFGYKVPERSIISPNVGKPIDEYYFILTGSKEHIKDLIEEHRAFQLLNLDLSKLFPNTAGVLKNLHNKKYKLAAVTTRSKKTSHHTLKNAGIFDFFDVVISGEDANALKPDPAPLLKALELLKGIPQKAVMIGDSHLDIQAGKNASTKTIRVTYGFHKDKMHEPEPDFFIDDISDLLKIL